MFQYMSCYMCSVFVCSCMTPGPTCSWSSGILLDSSISAGQQNCSRLAARVCTPGARSLAPSLVYFLHSAILFLHVLQCMLHIVVLMWLRSKVHHWALSSGQRPPDHHSLERLVYMLLAKENDDQVMNVTSQMTSVLSATLQLVILLITEYRILISRGSVPFPMEIGVLNISPLTMEVTWLA